MTQMLNKLVYTTHWSKEVVWCVTRMSRTRWDSTRRIGTYAHGVEEYAMQQYDT